MSAYPLREVAAEKSSTVHATRRVRELLFHTEAACGRLLNNATSEERDSDVTCLACRRKLTAMDSEEVRQ